MSMDPALVLQQRVENGLISKSKCQKLLSEINGTDVTSLQGEDLVLPLKRQLASGEIDIKEFREQVNIIEEKLDEANSISESGSIQSSPEKPVEIEFHDGKRSVWFVLGFVGLGISIGILMALQPGITVLGKVVIPTFFALVGWIAGALLSKFSAQKRSINDLKQKIKILPDAQRALWEDVPQIINRAVDLNGTIHLQVRELAFPFRISSSKKVSSLHELAHTLAGMTKNKRAEFLKDQDRYASAKEKIRKDPLENDNGLKNFYLTCPHCGEKGKVRTKAVDHKQGIDGGKATAAVLTGGVSLLAGGGLSQVEKKTRAHCDNCSHSWLV